MPGFTEPWLGWLGVMVGRPGAAPGTPGTGDVPGNGRMALGGRAFPAVLPGIVVGGIVLVEGVMPPVEFRPD